MHQVMVHLAGAAAGIISALAAGLPAAEVFSAGLVAGAVATIIQIGGRSA